jgi:aromatic amino acid aminotransferase I / 2-aminoadipate transaminase
LAGIEAGALVMRGSWFYADKNAPHDTMFFRATYAAVPAEKLQEAIRRFGDAVRVSFGLKKMENGVENGDAGKNGE